MDEGRGTRRRSQEHSLGDALGHAVADELVRRCGPYELLAAALWARGFLVSPATEREGGDAVVVRDPRDHEPLARRLVVRPRGGLTIVEFHPAPAPARQVRRLLTDGPRDRRITGLIHRNWWHWAGFHRLRYGPRLPLDDPRPRAGGRRVLARPACLA